MRNKSKTATHPDGDSDVMTTDMMKVMMTRMVLVVMMRMMVKNDSNGD